MQPQSLSDDQLRSLAREIRAGSVGSETDWLEWKRSLDLTTAPARFEVARQILGIANRVPGLARRNCGGYGYILVGVEPGAMPGTDRIDPAQLHDGIDPYIGATGPAWQPRYIPVGNTTILAIEVEPPRSGDSIHPLKKTYDSHRRGAIFVRKNGKTHPAEPEDIKNLERRLQGAHLDLDLTLIGDLPTSWFDEQALIAAINRAADLQSDEQLRRAHRTQEPDPVAEAYLLHSRTMLGALGGPDDRTIEQYADELAQWRSEWTERAPEHWMAAYAAAGHGTCSLSLTNLTDRNFTSVEVCLEIPGAQVITDLDEVETHLPKMPRPLGQGRGLGLGGIRIPTVPVAGLHYSPEVWVDNDDDGAFVTWDVGDVRPEQTQHSDPLYVLVGEAPSTRQLSASWRATSKNVSGVASGVIELPLSEKPVLLGDIEHDLEALDQA